MPSFADLTEEFLQREFEESPVRASGLGLTEFDARLDDLSAAEFERRRSSDADWLSRFERVTDDLGFDEAIDRDTSLHISEMSWDEAVRFMLDHTALTEPTAKAEVTRYCAWPTQASSYLTGSLEIARIREGFFAKRGSSDTDALRAFHDGITSSGGLPIALAERAAMAVAPPADRAGVASA